MADSYNNNCISIFKQEKTVSHIRDTGFEVIYGTLTVVI